MDGERQLTCESTQCHDKQITEANGGLIPTTGGSINGHSRLSSEGPHNMNGDTNTKTNANNHGDIITTIQSNHAVSNVSNEPSSTHDNIESEYVLSNIENKPTMSVSDIVRSGLPFQPIERADLSNRLSAFDDFMFLIPPGLNDNDIVQVMTNPNENQHINGNSIHESTTIASIPQPSLSAIKETEISSPGEDVTKMHLSNMLLPVAPSVFEQQLQQIKINQKNKQTHQLQQIKINQKNTQQMLTTTIPNSTDTNPNFTSQPSSTSNLNSTKNSSTIFHKDGGEMVVDREEDISL